MVDSVKISDLTAGSFKPTDLYPAVDVTDHSQAPSGTTKKYATLGLITYLFNNFNGNSGVIASTGFLINRGAASATGAAFTFQDQSSDDTFAATVYSRTNGQKIIDYYTNQTTGKVRFFNGQAVDSRGWQFNNTATLSFQSIADNGTVQFTPLTLSRNGDVSVGGILTANGSGVTNASASSIWSRTIENVDAPTDRQVLLYSTSNNKWNYVSLIPSDVGLGNVTNNAQLVKANNLSDLANLNSALMNLGLASGNTPSFTQVLLSAVPTVNNNAATKLYVDTAVGAVNSFIPVVGTSQTLSNGKGYLTTNASLTTFSLPASCNAGDVFYIAGFGTGGWSVAQNTGQTIKWGNFFTTTGTSGSLSSNLDNDCITIICATDNTDFVIFQSQGDISIA